MARPLLQPKADRTNAFRTGEPGASVLLLVVAVAAATIVVSLCTSGKNARPRKQRRSSLAPAPQEQEQDNDVSGGAGRNKPQLLLASLSGIGVKAAKVAKMVSWNRRSPPPAAGGWSSSGGGGGDDDDDDVDVLAADGAAAEEAAVWKKTIIMGDKCRPLEFSGHIAYDSDGNLLPPPTPVAKEDAAADAAKA